MTFRITLMRGKTKSHKNRAGVLLALEINFEHKSFRGKKKHFTISNKTNEGKRSEGNKIHS